MSTLQIPGYDCVCCSCGILYHVWSFRTTTLPQNIAYHSKTDALQYPRNMENSAEPLLKASYSEYDVTTLGTSRILHFLLKFIECFWGPAKLWAVFTDNSLSLRVTEFVMSATTSEYISVPLLRWAVHIWVIHTNELQNMPYCLKITQWNKQSSKNFLKTLSSLEVFYNAF